MDKFMYHDGVDYVQPLEALFPGAAAAVVGVLIRSEQPLSLRQVGERAGVSHPQVARHVDRLEELGIVTRRVVGRSHLVELTGAVGALVLRHFSSLDQPVWDHMRATSAVLMPNALSVTVFGSFARGSARAGSDIDIAIVATDPDDESWSTLLDGWVAEVSALAGNPVAEIVLSRKELLARRLDPVWQSITVEGVCVAGRPVGELMASTKGKVSR